MGGNRKISWGVNLPAFRSHFDTEHQVVSSADVTVDFAKVAQRSVEEKTDACRVKIRGSGWAAGGGTDLGGKRTVLANVSGMKELKYELYNRCIDKLRYFRIVFIDCVPFVYKRSRRCLRCFFYVDCDSGQRDLENNK